MVEVLKMRPGLFITNVKMTIAHSISVVTNKERVNVYNSTKGYVTKTNDTATRLQYFDLKTVSENARIKRRWLK